MVDAFSHAKFLTEFYVSYHMTDKQLLESMSLSAIHLLTEQVRIDNIAEKVKQTKADLAVMSRYFDASYAADLSKEIMNLAKSIPDPTNLVNAAYGEDEEKVKNMAKDFSTKMNNAVIAAATIVNAIQRLNGALQPFVENLSDEDKSLSIAELSEKTKSDKSFSDMFVTPEKLKAGLRKSFVPSQNFKSAFNRGVQAAQERVPNQGKSKLGRLFSMAGKFLAGFFNVPPATNFPKLLMAFETYIKSATVDDLAKMAEKLKISADKKIVGKAATTAATTTADIAVVAGGAKPAEDDRSNSSGKKIKTGDLERELGGDEKARSFVSALKNNDMTKDLFEENVNMHDQPTIMFEVLTDKDLIDIAKNVKGIDSAEIPKMVMKAARFFKSKGADVSISNDFETVQQTQSSASTTMGKAIHKAVTDYTKPFYDRKSLSKKKKAQLAKSVKDDLTDVLDDAAEKSSKTTVSAFKDAMEVWFGTLDSSLQKDLGGPVGSKKLMQKVAKNIEDVVTTNFKIEENKQEKNTIDRWQTLAGIK